MHESFDVAIICALHDPELKQVLDTGTKPWAGIQSERHDPSTYHSTKFTTNAGKPLRIIAAAANRMGMAASSVLATKMIIKYCPQLVVMVGIAAGAKPDKQGYGDILAADKTFDYGAGKENVENGIVVFHPDPDPIPIQAQLLARLKYSHNRATQLNKIREKWVAKSNDNTLPNASLRLHLGPIASGSAVIDHLGQVSKVKDHWRKLIGIEMEAYGVHCACEDSIVPPPAYLCFKSICDFAERKSDEWQSYAAFTAAQFCHEFLVNEWDGLQFVSMTKFELPKKTLGVLEFAYSILGSVIQLPSDIVKSKIKQNMQKELYYGSEIAILTCSGTYVGVNLNESAPTFGRLNGVSTKVQEWERFTLVDPLNPDGPPLVNPLHYGDKIVLRAARNRIVGADFGVGGEVVANVKGIDGWEIFTILPPVQLNAQYGTPLSFGFPFALQACLNKHKTGFESPYVMFNCTGDRTLLATAGTLDRWETFVFVDPQNPF